MLKARFEKAISRLWKPVDVRNIPPVPLVVGTFFYAGLSPVASGTVGSLVAATIAFAIPSFHSVAVLLIASVIVFVAGWWAGDKIEKASGEQDPSMVVIDEVCGQWLALIPFATHLTLGWMLVGFVLFRIFDVLKIWPASIFEDQHGGFSVMMDDVVAGLFAMGVGYGMVYCLA